MNLAVRLVSRARELESIMVRKIRTSMEGIRYASIQATLPELLSIGLTQPQRAIDNLKAYLRRLHNRLTQNDLRPPLDAIRLSSAEDFLRSHLANAKGVADFAEEFKELQKWLESQIGSSQPLGFPPFFSLEYRQVKALYILCRAMRPQVVVETGVANGTSSACILKALERNRKGTLWSIDYPPSDDFRRSRIGVLVPEDLKGRWNLILQDSVRGLKRVIKETQAIDIFLHDSEHTYTRMWREYTIVWPMLASGGLLLSDDVDQNHAFVRFAQRVGVEPLVIEPGLGLLIKRIQ